MDNLQEATDWVVRTHLTNSEPLYFGARSVIDGARRRFGAEATVAAGEALKDFATTRIQADALFDGSESFTEAGNVRLMMTDLLGKCLAFADWEAAAEAVWPVEEWVETFG